MTIIFSSSPLQNNINVKSSSSAHVAPEDRRSGPEHRLALPWAQGTNVHRDGPGTFILDLHNFPDLSKADINGQNPNIQVIMCVCAPASRLWCFSLTCKTWLLKHTGQEEQTGRERIVWCTSLPPFSPTPSSFLLPLSSFTPPGSQWSL